MAQLVLPDLDDDLVQRLRQRAARHGRTPEEEIRLILEQTLLGDAASTDLIREERDRRAGLIE